jgi:hypothetical protein
MSDDQKIKAVQKAQQLLRLRDESWTDDRLHDIARALLLAEQEGRIAGLREAAKIAAAQPDYPDTTKLGMRQEWVKAQISAKCEEHAAQLEREERKP